MSILRRSVTSKGGGRRRRWRLVVAVAASVASASRSQQAAGARLRVGVRASARTDVLHERYQWAPYGDVNPAKTWDYVDRARRPRVRDAFRYNPLTASSSRGSPRRHWRTKNVYVMNIRRGVKFSDGTTLTAGDVKYSFDLLKIPTHPQHALWATTGLKSVKVVGNTVVFTFAGKPGYQQFDFYRYNVAIVPQHVSATTARRTSRRATSTPSKIVGTGPYVYQSGVERLGADVRLAAEERLVGDEGARHQAGAAVRRRHPEHDERGGAREPAQAGNIDLFNNFAPRSAISGQVQDLLQQAPYHLGANTTWLFPNTTKKPLNDRRSAGRSRTRST